jgi:hypothetical protein
MLSRWERTITDGAGNRLDRPEITVRRHAVGTPLAVLKADIDGATPLSNPFTPPANVDPFFYVAGGLYQITVHWGTSSLVFPHVALGTAAGTDSPPLVVRGNWDNVTQFYINNIVRNGTKTYLAIAESIAIQPGVTADWADYWFLLAQDGTNGLDGAGVIGGVLSLQETTTPATPTAGNGKLYEKADMSIYRLGSNGVETKLHDDPQLSALIRQNSQSAAYTIVATDSGFDIFHPSTDNNARTYTIPSNASVPLAIGTCFCFTNMINILTIAITTDTLIWLGSGATGSRALAANGMAVARKVAATTWVISGVNLS